MIKLQDIIEDLELGKVYTDKDRPPFQVEQTINEAPEHDLARELNKISDMIIKIADKYKKKADVDGMVRSWMLGLHSRLKKSGIKAESINEGGEKTYKELMKVEKVINNLERMFKSEQREMARPRVQNVKNNLVKLKRAWTAIWADFQGG